MWTALYVMMAIAAWRVWRRKGFLPAWRPLGLFLLQLLLNAGWTFLFFGLHQPGWAFAELVCLWLAIVATTRAFERIDGLAAWLMAPYLGWVTFAAALNAAIWTLNRG